MSEILIKNGRVLDPASGFDQVTDVYLKDARIEEIRPRIRSRREMEVIDATDLFVLPGLIDMHTHLREPGQEHKETIRTGTEAAAAGGFTSIVSMANTNPVNDCATVTRFIRGQIRMEALVNVYMVGAATQGLEGQKLADIGEMAQYGIVAISDDGHCIQSANLMRRVFEYAKTFGLPVITHSEDPDLGGMPGVNEGWVSTQLGLAGSPNAAEETMVARDCALAALSRAHLHVAHVSTREGLEVIRAAKARGQAVTCEVTPHHLALTDEALLGFSTDAKVNPPLRSDEDRRALIQGIKQGTIDVIATDHAPHSPIEKSVSFHDAAPGMIGLETAVPVVWAVAQEFDISPLILFAKMTSHPAKILRLQGRGRLESGCHADVTLFDPNHEWEVKREAMRSKSFNTPFAGRTLKGRIVKTIVGGEIVYEAAG